MSYCSNCGSELVFVCKKCGSRIEDEGPKHTICASCEAERQDHQDAVVEVAQKVAAGAGAVGAATAAVLTSAPELAEGAVHIAVDLIDVVKCLRR